MKGRATSDPEKMGTLGTKAREEAITIAKWAKSCKTEEQFANVERFANNRKWECSLREEADVEYYMGWCSGFVLGIRKTKFNLDNSK